MKYSTFFLSLLLVISACSQEDKSKRPSPPDSVSATLQGGTTVSISYSQPAVKGRTIGKDLEPMPGTTGAGPLADRITVTVHLIEVRREISALSPQFGRPL